MTQLEFDKLMNGIRQEQEEHNAMLRAELHEIEQRRAAARKQFDDYHEYYKSICKEIEQKQKELKEANAQYYERKKNLIKAFPKAYGVQKEGNCRKRNECYALRAKMIANLKEGFKDTPNIDVDNINVQFTIEGENVTFTAIIPKRDDTAAV